MNAHPSVFPCASRDKEVAGYVLSHSLSPTMIAEYKTILPDKKMLQTKLHRYFLRLRIEGGK